MIVPSITTFIIFSTVAVANLFAAMAIGFAGNDKVVEIQIDEGVTQSDQIYEIIMEQLRDEKSKTMSGDEIYQTAFDEVTVYVKPEEK